MTDYQREISKEVYDRAKNGAIKTPQEAIGRFEEVVNDEKI